MSGGGKSPCGKCPGWEKSGLKSQGGNCRGRKCPVEKFPGREKFSWKILGGNYRSRKCLGGKSPRSIFISVL